MQFITHLVVGCFEWAKTVAPMEDGCLGVVDRFRVCIAVGRGIAVESKDGEYKNGQKECIGAVSWSFALAAGRALRVNEGRIEMRHGLGLAIKSTNG